MNKYNKVKFYYDNGLSSLDKVRNAVVKGWITTEEYYIITGEKNGEEFDGKYNL